MLLVPPSVTEVGLGRRAAAKVPETIFVAFVVSVVAEGEKREPLVFVHVTARVLLVVQSPERLPLVIALAPENIARFPVAGDPVVVTVPSPEAEDHAAAVPFVPKN